MEGDREGEGAETAVTVSELLAGGGGTAERDVAKCGRGERKVAIAERAVNESKGVKVRVGKKKAATHDGGECILGLEEGRGDVAE